MWPPRLVVEACGVILAWVLAAIAYLLGRHAAIGPLLFSGVFIVVAEATYDVNTYADGQIGGRTATSLGHFVNRLSFVVLWPAALLTFAFGAILLTTGARF